MAVTEPFIEQLREALSPLGSISIRRMFGGAGVYCGPVMFALAAEDTLYLKADDNTFAGFVAEGLGPFVYEGKGRPIRMSYWRAPDRLLDDPDEMLQWAGRALAVARNTRRSRAGAGSKTKTAGRADGTPRR